MADYFFVLDGKLYRDEVRPALGESWRARSFAPCHWLCESLAPAATDYAARYHAGSDVPMLLQVQNGVAFDRAVWRALAGEVLLFAAAELPEFPTHLDGLVWLLAAPPDRTRVGPREGLPEVRQALEGSRDVMFGAASYRPFHAGYNDASDVARLAAFLAAIDPDGWRADDLDGLPGVEAAEDREDELALARDWLPVLADLYGRVRDAGQVVVIERLF